MSHFNYYYSLWLRYILVERQFNIVYGLELEMIKLERYSRLEIDKFLYLNNV